MEYPKTFEIQPTNVSSLHTIYTNSYNTIVLFKPLVSNVYIMPPKGTNLVNDIRPWKTEWQFMPKQFIHGGNKQSLVMNP